MATTLFEKYGGFASVSRIVLAFYDRVGESDLLAPYFADTDMRALVDHQTKFIAALMGGPASYTDETLRRVHEGLGVTGEAFAEMTAILEETLDDFALAPDDVAAVMYEIRRRQPLIVSA